MLIFLTPLLLSPPQRGKFFSEAMVLFGIWIDAPSKVSRLSGQFVLSFPEGPVKRRPVLAQAPVGEEQRLACLAEEPILVLPAFARNFGFAVGAEGCQFHIETPFTGLP